jgi:uncharacterized protein
MKRLDAVIFFGVFFTVYGLVNYYIFIRGWQALPRGAQLRGIYALLFFLLALSFFGGRFAEASWPSAPSRVLVWIGSFWFGAMLYFFLAVLLLDAFRFAGRLVPFSPAWVASNCENAGPWTLLVVAIVVVLVLAAGHINSLTIRVKNLSMDIPKPVNGTKRLVVVAASDIHLGTIMGRKSFEKIVERINALDADLVLLPGDIVDEDLGPVVRQNLGEKLREIRSRYGVVAITGNHEYIGGVEEACDYLSDHGVTVLRDDVMQLPGGIFLVGREDRSIRQFAQKERKALPELMAKVDRRRPVILLDHQPFHLEEAAGNGVDVQLSGHTHHGQLWPLNYITRALYAISWGYLRVGETHVYVSSGVGTWGPPARIGNHPEILHLTLNFE